MKILAKKPLLWLCVGFCASAFCLSKQNEAARLLAIAALSIVLVLFLILLLLRSVEKRHSLFPLLPVLLGLFGGCLSAWLYFDRQVASVTARNGESGLLIAEITETSYYSEYTTVFLVTAQEWQGQDASFRAVLELPFACDAETGDRISVNTSLFCFPESEKGFPLRDYYASQGIFLAATAEENAEVTLESGNGGILTDIHRLSDTLAARLRLMLGNHRGSFLSGILLGRKDDVPDTVTRDFRYLGLSHVLAVSGLHLSVLVGGFLLLLRFLRLPHWLQLVLSTALILFFALLTGLSASVIRSGIMLIMTLVAFVAGERYDPPTALGLAAALLLLFSPGAVSDVGFLLSVSATAGIIAVGSPLSSAILSRAAKMPRPLRLLGKPLADMAVTVGAVFFTLPFVAQYFGEFSLVSPLANLIFLPLTSAALFLGILLIMVGTTPLLPLVAHLTEIVLNTMLGLAEKCAASAPEPVSLRYSFTLPFLGIAAGVWLLLVFLKKKRTVAVTVPILVFGLLFGGGCLIVKIGAKDVDRIVTVSSGKNDYLLLHRDGSTLLCDFSDGSYSAMKGAASLSSALLHDSSPDGLLLTHLHKRHLSSFSRLADTYRLSYLYLPEPTDESSAELVDQLASAASERDITVFRYAPDRSSVLYFADFAITVHPTAYLDRSSHPLLLLEVVGNRRTVYLGGSRREASDTDTTEASLANADLVWLGVHGPVIRHPLRLPLSGTVLASNESVNHRYQTAYTPLGSGEFSYRLISHPPLQERKKLWTLFS